MFHPHIHGKEIQNTNSLKIIQILYIYISIKDSIYND